MSEAHDGTAEAVAEDTSHVDLTPEDTTQEDQSGADAAAEADEGEGEQPKPKKSAQDRIDELTRDKHAERRAREAAERRLAELEAQVRPKAENQPKADEEPDPAKYTYGETDQAYIRDYAAFVTRQTIRQEMQERERRAQTQTVEQAWHERQQDFAKEHPDYFETVHRQDLRITPVMADAIKTSDDGARVAYHLAQHPDEARRIAGLPPLAQVRELGKLEAKLATPAASTPQPKTVSDAPAPHPTARGAGGRFAPAPDTSDFAAFEKLADGFLHGGR